MCGVCHKIVKDAPKALGPNLWGVGGRTSGTLAGFNYSPAMKNARLQWNRPSLIAFISNPKAKIPGNRMAYAGQKNPAAATAIADYLLSLKRSEEHTSELQSLMRISYAVLCLHKKTYTHLLLI